MFTIKKIINNRQTKNSGETLIEVLIAVTIFSTVLIGALTALSKSISSLSKTKNRIVALNLAREGVEAVRSIRDTNWIKYSGDRDAKWLKISSDKNIFIEKTGENYYIPIFSNSNKKYELKEIDISGFNLTKDPTSLLSIYRHNIDDEEVWKNKNATTTLTNHSPSKFYRVLKLKVLDPECPLSKCKNQGLNIVSKVWWKKEEGFGSVTTEANLFNFYGRNAY
jgi:type II secretory pathway pseudopilin PulG